MWTKLIPLRDIFNFVKPKKRVVLEVPVEIYDDFIEFLDNANVLLWSEEDLEKNENLAKLAKLIDGWMGGKASPRCGQKCQLKEVYRIWGGKHV